MHYRRQKRETSYDEALCGAHNTAEPYTPTPMTDTKSAVTCWRCILLVLGRPLPAEPPVPEHEKLEVTKRSVTDATQMLGEFLNEFLPSESVRLARWGTDDELHSADGEKRSLIAKFFEIDENALESEKQALLEYQRNLNTAHTWAETEGRAALRDP